MAGYPGIKNPIGIHSHQPFPSRGLVVSIESLASALNLELPIKLVEKLRLVQDRSAWAIQRHSASI